MELELTFLKVLILAFLKKYLRILKYTKLNAAGNYGQLP